MRLTENQLSVLRTIADGWNPAAVDPRTPRSLYTRGLIAVGAGENPSSVATVWILTDEGRAALAAIDAPRVECAPLTQAEIQRNYRARRKAELARLRAMTATYAGVYPRNFEEDGEL